jgi:hypothetical protein
MNVLLVPPPHLGFSSNVMTFTGTVLALGFGGIFSLLVKRPGIGYRGKTRRIRSPKMLEIVFAIGAYTFNNPFLDLVSII